MAFPTTPILSSLTGADENPLSEGGNWKGPAFAGDAQGARVGNRATSATAGWGGSYWNAASFTGDTEVYATVGLWGGGVEIFLFLHFDPVGNSGYVLDINKDTGTGAQTWTLSKYVAGAQSNLDSGGAAGSTLIDVGDSFGMRKVGDTIEVWRKSSGGVWLLLGSGTDNDFNTGRLSYEVHDNGVAIDDLGGGLVQPDVGFPVAPVLSSFSGANETPLSEGGNWDGPMYAGEGSGSLVSNRATTNSVSRGGSYWAASYFEGESEAYATLPSLTAGQAAYLFLNFHPENRNGYVLGVQPNLWQLGRYDSDAVTVLASGGMAASAGDSFGLARRGDTIQAYRRRTGGWAWAYLGSPVDDTTYRYGRIGYAVGASGTEVDDFGGGGDAMDWIPNAVINLDAALTTSKLPDRARFYSANPTFRGSIISGPLRARVVLTGQGYFEFDPLDQLESILVSAIDAAFVPQSLDRLS